jgi:environmental stress-induced protein Ves
MQTVSLADIVPTPWKNQRGTTQELLAWPESQNWLLRLSVATIGQSGEFSKFDGITRWFTVIDGDGVDLIIGQSQVSLDAGADPVCFSGGLPCTAALKGGTVHAFNGMFIRGFDGRVVRVRSGESIALGTAGFVAIYGIDSSDCEIAQDEIAQDENASVSKVSLKAGDLHWIADRAKLSGPMSRQLRVHDGHVVVLFGSVLNS